LFDLYSNFTYYLDDPINGDAFQQHDSRLNQGGDIHYQRTQLFDGGSGVLSVGAGMQTGQNQIELRQAMNRDPVSTSTAGHAAVTNGSGFVQEAFDFGRLQLTGGLRWDLFRYAVTDVVDPQFSGAEAAAKLQPKASVGFRPLAGTAVQTFFNYGRGITSVDARGVIRQPESPRISTTDFYQFGLQQRVGDRWSMMASYFLIHNSNQLVYVPDDGSLELTDPTESAGIELRTSLDISRRLSFNGGITKVFNAYYRDTAPRIYIDSAPHFTSNAALTLSGWRGWSGSLRMRSINHYRLDGEDPSIQAAGNTVFDLAASRRIHGRLDLNFSVDNLFDRVYWETQNYFESRLRGGEPRSRIHGTPSFGRTITVGLTLRFGAK
jgi:outer membrane receptor protein involved in Fe transport